ncbi:sugar phosphate nucleotidyltransferase [uncultured Bacteroides sp.]|uniref:nucleotidyltransferase family protein n=1 Tax=uncultured Bacteroides sp. TaxID=162156 RepID=UPI002610A699|nr:sugar phosphate nucleotidyltransferase [uncultured Bacteroides sp.]
MKPTLFVLAAGMGSRYGGLKQLDGLGPNGETIMDYSIYDAIHAGFGKVVFVIRKDFEQDFRDKILSKYEGHIPVEVVFQSVDKLPEGFTCPADRTKPWGPAHAVLMAKDAINGPFAVINADDYYGRNSFEVLAKELMRERDRKGDYCMVGFRVGNTVTENGTVSRGVCENKDGYLTSVVERKAIGYNYRHQIAFNDEYGTEQVLDPMTPVSMNMWGFTPDYFDYGVREFSKFLSEKRDMPKSEQVLPDVADALIKSGEATVKVLDTDSQWFGVTYAEDRPGVVAKFLGLHESGVYPGKLF